MPAPKKIAIVGSCVSRDVFRVCEPDDFEIAYYCMNSCVPTMMAKPSPIPAGTDLSQISPFYQRNVQRDFEKTLFEELSSTSYDAILLDLIEERHDLYLRDDEAVCDSYGLGLTTLKRECDERMTFVKRLSLPLNAYDRSFELFSDRLATEADGRPVFLTMCHFADRYVAHKSLREFEPTSGDAHNRMLDHYYEILSSNAAMVGVDARGRGFRGAAEHKWGLHPFHYEDPYYEFVLERIRSHFASKMTGDILSDSEYRSSPHFTEITRDIAEVRDLFIGAEYRGCLERVENVRGVRSLTADECHYYGRSLLQLPDRQGEAAIYLEAALREGVSEPGWVHLSLTQARRQTGAAHRAMKSLTSAVSHAEGGNHHFNSLVYREMTQLIGDPGLTRDDQAALIACMSRLWFEHN